MKKLLLSLCISVVGISDLPAQVSSTFFTKHLSDAQILASAQGAGPQIQPSSFWLRISNDHKFSILQRREAAVILCRRYVRSGMSLIDFGKLMEKTNWLKRDDVRVVKDVTGFIPITIDNSNSIVELDLVSEKNPKLPGILYLKVEGWHPDESLKQWIFDRKHCAANAPMLLDVVVSDFSSGAGRKTVDVRYNLHVTSDQVF